MWQGRGRRWIILFALFVLALGVCVVPWSSENLARNVILMIGDGMGPNQMYVYEEFARVVLKQELSIVRFMNKGTTAWMTHYPNHDQDMVTDSAASATSMASGIKTRNRYLGVDVEGNSVPNMLEIAKANGKRTGIVCNLPPFDATEAAFTAHVSDRGELEEIVEWTFARTKPDLVLGDNGQVFGGTYVEKQPQIERVATVNGYKVIHTAQEYGEIQLDQPTYGAFIVETPYQKLPSPSQRQSVTLSELTSEALRVLSQAEQGFFLMVEGANIDKWSHANDAGGVMREMAEFDRAIGVALDFAQSRADTLLLVTADHETGGLAIMSGAKEESLRQLGAQRKSLSLVQRELGDHPTVEAIQQAFRDALQMAISRQDAETIYAEWSKDPRDDWGAIVKKRTNIGFLSTAHTATPVLLAGYGPGSEACGGWRDNTDIFAIMMKAAGLVR